MSDHRPAAQQDRLSFRAVDAMLRVVLRVLPTSSLSERIALEWGYRYRPLPRIVKLRSGARFHFDRVDFIPLLLYYTGVFEPGMLRYLRALLKPGDVVVDVGANVGFHTLECWNVVGPNGQVISIEASPDHVESIRRNLRTNDYPDDNVLNVAVGDSDGEASLGLPEGGNQGMFGINAGSGGAFNIALRRIDDLLKGHQLSSLAVIKMDIEGSELSALRGASDILRRLHPAILIELNATALARCGASPSDVVRLLEDHCYQGWVIGRGHAQPIIAGMAHDCDECLFLPHHAVALRTRLNLPERPS